MLSNLLAGRKTYAAAVVIVGLAFAQYFGVNVPPEAWLVLNGLGLGFLRNAVSKS